MNKYNYMREQAKMVNDLNVCNWMKNKPIYPRKLEGNGLSEEPFRTIDCNNNVQHS
jgi:hypothetical protein